jgi:hypothetical protein
MLKDVEMCFSPVILLSILQGLGVVFLPSLTKQIFIVNYIGFFVVGICFFKIQEGTASRSTLFVLSLSLLSNITSYSIKHFMLFALFISFSIRLCRGGGNS